MKRRIFILVSALAGCSLTTSLSGLSGGPNDAPTPTEGGALPEGAAPGAMDAAVEAASDARSDASTSLGPNLYPAGNFDSPTSSLCMDTGYHSDVALDSPGRNLSAFDCEVCAAGMSNDLYTLDRFTSIAPRAGERYRVTAWVKVDSPALPPSNGVTLALRSAVADPFQVFDEKVSDSVVPTAAWQQLSVDLPITTDAPSLEYYIGGLFTPSSCFLVDDIEIRKYD